MVQPTSNQNPSSGTNAATTKASSGGYLVLRYYYDDVIHRPDAMVAEVQAVLRRWRRPTNNRDGNTFAKLIGQQRV